MPRALLLFSKEILKLESPLTNPDIQKGSGIPLNLYLGLSTLNTSVKANLYSSWLNAVSELNPLFKLYFNDIIFTRPFSFKCSLFFY